MSDTDWNPEIRSLFLNLKDKGNPGLRDKIVLGVLDAEAVVNMSKEVSLFQGYGVEANAETHRTWHQPVSRL